MGKGGRGCSSNSSRVLRGRKGMLRWPVPLLLILPFLLGLVGRRGRASLSVELERMAAESRL